MIFPRLPLRCQVARARSHIHSLERAQLLTAVADAGLPLLVRAARGREQGSAAKGRWLDGEQRTWLSQLTVWCLAAAGGDRGARPPGAASCRLQARPREVLGRARPGQRSGRRCASRLAPIQLCFVRSHPCEQDRGAAGRRRAAPGRAAGLRPHQPGGGAHRPARLLGRFVGDATRE